jgi:indole-3-glycerol phosphate synthase
VLLIVAALEPPQLEGLIALAAELGLAALVEVHDQGELSVALDAGAQVVGVNNRDLTTFEVDLGVTERLAAMVPEDRLVVGESGINSRAEVERLGRAGVNAVLVGTALMRADSPGDALRALTGVAVSR